MKPYKMRPYEIEDDDMEDEDWGDLVDEDEWNAIDAGFMEGYERR